MYKIELELLKSCNLRCKYCYQSHDTKIMDMEVARESIRFGMRRACELRQNNISIIYYGGEALIRYKDIVELTNYAREISEEYQLSPNFEITTNGTLLNKEVCEFLLHNDFLVKISLDGTRTSHDLNRVDTFNNSSYDLIMNNIAAINYFQERTKNPIQISMIVSKNTCSDFFNNFKHIVNLGFKVIDFGLNYKDEWSSNDLYKLELELDKAIEFHFQRAKQGKRFVWTFVNKNILPQIKQRKNYFCGAGVISNFITTDGSIYPCSGCTKSEVRIGHIKNGYINEKINFFKCYERNLCEECEKCDIKKYCAACDCILMNVELTGKYNKVPRVFCEQVKIGYKLANKLLCNTDWVNFMGINNIK